ncbi:type II toxin-antitoxin system prevent-host-death family antitoxin [Microlunatus elymi]|uniref:Antitoxin n=1 Tax=Microlunatus elymi TaxID=2596828 RepID=A0A516Q3P1_9ACTN|nr:type II toxin-antitoxin system prevent-host-death family antitoxin [Microlunatus elymi]QDP98049.1 type II toxin-antitoxin system prevent-host-death family antitoxin [Microlunatus elymi]
MSIHVGLRELRQNASELVRRVEAGEDITVTVAGRPAVHLVAAAGVTSPWRTWDQVADLFNGPADTAWEHDRERLDDLPQDPWTVA